MHTHNLDQSDFEISEIESIELIGEAETVDITVEDVHMFYANDIYTHNSALNKDSFTMEAIGESLGKAATADLVIGLARSDESKVANEATLGILKNRNGADGFYLPAIFDTSRVFIELVQVQPGIVVQGQKNASTNKKTEKTQKEDLENISNILGDTTEE